MTPQLDTRLMPAQNPTSLTPKAGADGEGVNEVALIEFRKARGTRPWDQLSEIDRQILLEAVRQRRRREALKTRIYSELYGMRTYK
ncbi:MAG: hypothetical protein JWQ91_2200 [Aeromicrobium sp.]|jgi:hypothetical protein|nr:hypothetical protein [Aeromicrobium sp.]MCW2825283.1 hypothetical protein [Aeromicrobium sp.]